MYIEVYMYIHTCTNMHKFMHTHTQIYIYTHTNNTHTQIYVYTHTNMSIFRLNLKALYFREKNPIYSGNKALYSCTVPYISTKERSICTRELVLTYSGDFAIVCTYIYAHTLAPLCALTHAHAHAHVHTHKHTHTLTHTT